LSGQQQHDYPSDDEIVAAVLRLGSVSAVAREIGLKVRTLGHYVNNRPELNARCKQAVREHLMAKRTPSSATLEADEDVSREDMLRQENAELRRALARARSDDVKFERVLEALEASLRVAAPTYRPKVVRSMPGRQPHTLILLWSDQHAAEAVSLEQTNGLNEYNWEIMMRRHDELRRGIASWAAVFGPVDRLLILALGDGLSGNIHEELAETNEMPLAEATVQWGVDAAEWLRTLPDVIPWAKRAVVDVVAVPGNHPRAHKKPRAKHKHDNADWVSANIMRQALSREDWISFQVPRGSRHLVDVHGRKILAMHGDAVPPSAMVGVPWGGVIRLEARLRNQFHYDHIAMGHFHEPNIIGNRRIWVNGSVKGPDEYGVERYGGGAGPSQLLIPFHPRYGMVGCQFIDLEPDDGLEPIAAMAAA
jgi:transposase-like protein